MTGREVINKEGGVQEGRISIWSLGAREEGPAFCPQPLFQSSVTARATALGFFRGGSVVN